MPLDGPFIGSEALARGLVTKHHLRARCQAVFPDVYLPEHLEPTLAHRTRAAWLWSRRGGVVAGAAAAGVHGVRWIPDDEPIELVWSNARPPTGIITRRDRLGEGEVQRLRGLPVTTPVRTAFDLGRLTHGERGVARLDALGNATRFDPGLVLEVG